MNDSVRGTFTYRWRIDVRKLLVGFAGLAIAACQSDVMEAVPETPNDRAVTELLALMGSTYDENSDDRLRSALGLPSDFPIGAIVYATVDGGSSGVSADFLPPECSIRDGATREEAEEFTRCHECPRSYSCGSGIQGAAVGIAILGGPVAEAQQVVEVDFEVGRTIYRRRVAVDVPPRHCR
ncbi:MAG: hypothetical protein OXH66_19385 [Gemmatimonadetes bacterium]|nr:hypothetical protein [Gemmatimonadota bacterium]